MLEKKSAAIIISVVIVVSGCSVLNTGTDTADPDNHTQDTVSVETTSQSDFSNKSSTDTPKTDNGISGESTYINSFESLIDNDKVDIINITKENNSLKVSYVGNFSNKSRTTSEIAYILTKYAAVVNKSYNNDSNWNITKLNLVGKSPNGSVIWDTRTEDWWAAQYAQSYWNFKSYLEATVATGEYWNVSKKEPPTYGDEYVDLLKNRLENQTEIDIVSLETHGAEAFLTYRTERSPKTSHYASQLINITDTYGNITLPRSLNYTGGWYPGILNIEIQREDDTIEWYRYSISWGEEVVKGNLSRGEELDLIGGSRFPEKDRLRDAPDPDE